VGNNFLKREPTCVTKKPTKVADQGGRNSGKRESLTRKVD